MLVVTPAAAAAIELLLGAPTVPDDAGLRLAPDEEEQTEAPPGATVIAISVVSSGDVDDQVVPATDSHPVFVDQRIADVLDDQVLDADIGDQFVFRLRPQATNGWHAPPDTI